MFSWYTQETIIFVFGSFLFSCKLDDENEITKKKYIYNNNNNPYKDVAC